MDEEKIKQLEDYFSSLKKGDIIRYPAPHDKDKTEHLLFYEVLNGKIRGQKLGPYGLSLMYLEDIAVEDIEVANFKRIGAVLKKKSKK